jgi:rhodanese-related sulfurtransferase
MSKAEPDMAAQRPRTFAELVEACQSQVKEVFPWDLTERLEADKDILLLDVREPYEFDAMRIDGSINVPRGVLESACDYGYEETVPELVESRDREIVIICRSGYRSLLAGLVMQQMGFRSVSSLKTGLRGWSEFEQELVNADGKQVSFDDADEYFMPRLRPEQLGPSK